MSLKKRAILGLALAWLVIGGSEGYRGSGEEYLSEDYGDSSDEPQYRLWKGDLFTPKIDAFNPKKCGDAIFRPWQASESAFGFARTPRSQLVREPHGLAAPDNSMAAAAAAITRIYRGQNATDGEFPFFVKLGQQGDCGGILVHSDLVLTAGHCVLNQSSIEVFLGSNKLDGKGAVVKKADKWCVPSKFSCAPNMPCSHDLAIIKLKKPVAYVPHKISSACLLPDRRHLDYATCAVAGFGVNGIGYNRTTKRWYYTRPEVLQTTKLHRNPEASLDPHVSIYTAEDDSFLYTNDSGGPIVCYDKSLKDHSMMKAYVVGALQQRTVDSDSPLDEQRKNLVLDFHKAKVDLVGLVREARRVLLKDPNFKCAKPGQIIQVEP